MKTLRQYWSVAAMSIRLSIQSCFEYPLAFVGWLISNPMQFLVGFATIKFVVMEFDALADWNFKELAFLYGMSVLSHGLSVIFFTKTWYMGWTILRGEMDMLRLRPMNTLFQFLFGEMNFVGLTDLVPGVILFVYGCISVQFQWTLHNTAAMLCAVVGGTLLRGAFYLGFGSLTFWTKSPFHVSPGGTVHIHLYSAHGMDLFLSGVRIHGQSIHADPALWHGVCDPGAGHRPVRCGMRRIPGRIQAI